MRTPILITMLGLSLLACRSSNNGDDDSNPDATGTGPDSSTGAVTIQQVQNTAMAPGTAVSVQGVVVTAIDTFGTKTGDIWVEEPAGGAFSGVHVFGGPVATIAQLKVGDIVNITGAVKDEFALSSDTSGRTLVELAAGPNGMVITKTGTGTVPAPMVVDALAIGQMSTQAERDAQWVMWVGVLITVNKVSAFNTPKCVGSACTDPTEEEFDITGQAVVESELSMMPATGIALNTCLASVTGVEDYFFDYLILPRATADIVLNGTGCAMAEGASGTSPGTCTDGMDNDGNGFTDCMDLGCEVGANAWLGATCATTDTMCGCSTNYGTNSVTAINALTTLPTTPVLLHDVYVTAVSTKGIWVSDSLTAATGAGMFVFGTVTPAVTVGQKLATLNGTVAAFNPSKLTTGFQTQIEISHGTPGGATTGGTIVPVTLAASVAGDLVGGKAYAGSLVKLSTVAKVKSVGMFNQVVLEDNNNLTITMDDDAFPYYGGTSAAPTPPAVGACLQITGVMDVQTTDTAGMIEVRTINPRSAADMVTSTGCTGT